MDAFVKMDDVLSIFEMCCDISCGKCRFDIPNNPECKLQLWCNGLKRYQVEIGETDDPSA